MVKGEFDAEDEVLVQVHSECLTGDVFHSLRCDCGDQLICSLEMIGEEGKGALIYMHQEGRGIGLANKIKAYGLTHSPPQLNINVMGFLFEMGGVKIFHNGDTSYSAHAEFAAINLKQQDIDLGLIHKGMFFWNHQQGRRVVMETIKPKHLYLHHVYNDEQDWISKSLPELRKTFSSIDIPRDYLDKRIFKCD